MDFPHRESHVVADRYPGPTKLQTSGDRSQNEGEKNYIIFCVFETSLISISDVITITFVLLQLTTFNTDLSELTLSIDITHLYIILCYYIYSHVYLIAYPTRSIFEFSDINNMRNYVFVILTLINIIE